MEVCHSNCQDERKFTESGCSVAKAKDVADKINSAGGSAISIPGDMMDSEYIKTLVKKAAEFGNGKIHIIVNNAGYTWDGVIHKVCSIILYNMFRFYIFAVYTLVWHIVVQCQISKSRNVCA